MRHQIHPSYPEIWESVPALQEASSSAGLTDAMATLVELLHRRDADLEDAFGGREYATVVVAAADSHAEGRERANFVCDGTNDEVEIQKAIDICATLGFGRVELLEGNFHVAAYCGVGSYVTVQGQGRGTRIFLHGTQGAFALSGATFAEVRDLWISGTIAVPVGARGVTLNGCNDCLISGVTTDVAVYGVATYGIWVYNSSRTLVLNCRTRGVTDPSARATTDFGIYIQGGGSNVVGNCHVGNTCRGVIVYNSGGSMLLSNEMEVSGEVSDGIGSIAVLSSPRTIVAGNTVLVATQSAIYLGDSDNCVVTANVVSSSYFHPISLNSSSDCSVQGNMLKEYNVFGNGGATIVAGILLAGTSSRNNVQTNTLRCSTNIFTTYGVWVKDATCVDNWITNNDLLGSGDTPFVDAGTTTDTTPGNRPHSGASAGPMEAGPEAGLFWMLASPPGATGAAGAAGAPGATGAAGATGADADPALLWTLAGPPGRDGAAGAAGATGSAGTDADPALTWLLSGSPGRDGATGATGAAGASGGGTPTTINTPDTFTVAADTQVLWTLPILVNGILIVDGFLVEVN